MRTADPPAAMAESDKVCSRCSERKPSSEFTPRIRGIPESGYCRSCTRPVKHPHWQCPGCGKIIYYLGAGHHAHGCKDHPGCEKYQEAKYRASGMWPVNWSRERVQRASGETPEGGT